MNNVLDILKTVDLQGRIVEMEAEIREQDEIILELTKSRGRLIRYVKSLGLSPDQVEQIIKG